MTEPVTINLSKYQEALFAELATMERNINERRNVAIAAIISATHDPAAFAGWTVNINNNMITCTPPADG